MATIITLSDLPTALQSADLIDLMVDGANARAARVAPCLASTNPAPSTDQLAEARLVLVGAVKRWAETGAGALQSQQAGPYGMTVDTRQRTGFNLWPSEIEALQDICSDGSDTSTKAFTITPTGSADRHADWCALNFGATYCDCGAVYAGYPIFTEGQVIGP